MNLFKRMKLDSVVAKKPSVKRSPGKKKAALAKAVKVALGKVDPKEAPEEQAFWVNGGQSLRSIRDLREALFQMEDWQFDHHAKRDGNDFSRWVKEVFGEKALAKKIETAKDKKETVLILDNFLK
jgi:hypothetical protein